MVSGSARVGRLVGVVVGIAILRWWLYGKTTIFGALAREPLQAPGVSAVHRRAQPCGPPLVARWPHVQRFRELVAVVQRVWVAKCLEAVVRVDDDKGGGVTGGDKGELASEPKNERVVRFVRRV